MAVGLTDNPSALRRWMVAGPEVARVIEEFEDGLHNTGRKLDTRHHDQTKSVPSAFAKDVLSLATVVEELGNPFEEESSTRAKRVKGVRRRVVAAAAIPGNWQNCLREDSSKTELFRFLSDTLLKWFNLLYKQIVITDGEAVLSKPPLSDPASLIPCNREEADSRMLLHAYNAAQHGHHKIMIRTVDTDVVVLAISTVQALQPDDELWLAFGTGIHFRYLAAHKLAVVLGAERAKALPMFHALTGCDTVSCFAGHGQKGAWDVWNVLPELTDALRKLSSDDVMQTIARFVSLMYDRTSTTIDIDKARKKLFSKKNNVNLIPPTKGSLEEHVKRATLFFSAKDGSVITLE